MDQFSPSSDDCRAALAFVLTQLPSGFIDRVAFEPAWTTSLRDGTGGTRKVALKLKTLLPPDDQWPTLSPVCDLGPVPPTDLFLQTLDLEAYGISRRQRIHRTGDAFPWRRFMAVDDQRTCPEHRARDGLIRRYDDPFWVRFDAEFWWGCRCTSTVMNARTVQRRGYRLPD